MKDEIRLKRFLTELDQTLQENVDCKVDENGAQIMHNVTESTVYDWMMTDDDFHFLGSERVKSIVHSFMTDYNFRRTVLKCYGII